MVGRLRGFIVLKCYSGSLNSDLLKAHIKHSETATLREFGYSAVHSFIIRLANQADIITLTYPDTVVHVARSQLQQIQRISPITRIFSHRLSTVGKSRKIPGSQVSHILGYADSATAMHTYSMC